MVYILINFIKHTPMNNIIKVLLLVSVFFVACQNENKNASTIAVAMPAISDYSNAIAELATEHNAYLERLVNSTNMIKMDLQSNAYPLVLREAMPIFSTPVFIKADANPSKPPLTLKTKDRVELKNAIVLLNKDFELINETYASLTSYINTKDYEIDNGQRGTILLDSISNLSDKYATRQASVLEKIKVLNNLSETAHTLKAEVAKTRINKRGNIKREIKDTFLTVKADRAIADGYPITATPIKFGSEKRDSANKTTNAERKELIMLAEQESKLREAFRNLAD